MSEAKGAQPKSLGRRAYDFFSSIKLSIFVLIALAATSIFGTVIQQGKPDSVYVQEYGEAVASIIRALNLGDMYYSWWFILLLVLLLVNITFCSLKRLPHALKLMKERDPVFDGRPVAIHERWQLKVKGQSVADAAGVLEGVIRGKCGKVVRREVDGKVYLFGTRGGWSRMGVYVTHFSLFLFGLGAIVGAQWGYKGYVQIVEGETVGSVQLRSGGAQQLDFQLRCDDFDLEYYPDAQGRPTGRPKDYKSTLTVLENGREILQKTIEVNDPLIHHGIYFYQSSYGQAGGRGARLSVFGPRRNLIAHNQYLVKGGGTDLGDGARLLLRNLTGDFRGMGPAVEVALQQPGQETVSTVVFESSQGNQRKLGEYVVRVEAVDTAMYTGLQVAKDPGIPLIWAGCAFITLGCLVAFFVSHRRVWGRVVEDGKGLEVFLGGNASRNRISFEHWFGALCEEAQESFEK